MIGDKNLHEIFTENRKKHANVIVKFENTFFLCIQNKMFTKIQNTLLKNMIIFLPPSYIWNKLKKSDIRSH